jgi:hypothetical protein
VAGDLAFDGDDVRVIRRFVAGTLAEACIACGTTAPSHVLDRRRPGDVTPRGDTDGVTNVTDVVLALRFVVGVDVPSAEELRRADVAPVDRFVSPPEVVGDGVVEVGDVVVMLRQAIGLDALAWPVRRIGVAVGESGAYSAAGVRASGWPAWAESAGLESPSCPAPGGLEVEDELWGAACATFPLTASLPADVVTFRYRGIEPVAPSSLSLVLDMRDATLAPLPLPGFLEQR